MGLGLGLGLRGSGDGESPFYRGWRVGDWGAGFEKQCFRDLSVMDFLMILKSCGIRRYISVELKTSRSRTTMVFFDLALELQNCENLFLSFFTWKDPNRS